MNLGLLKMLLPPRCFPVTLLRARHRDWCPAEGKGRRSSRQAELRGHADPQSTSRGEGDLERFRHEEEDVP